MDSDELRARSIELAERAYRLKDTSDNKYLSEKFDNAAHALSSTTSTSRFYQAGNELDKTTDWSEAMRSLAHEINVADQSLRNLKALEISQTESILDKWSARYKLATSAEVRHTGAKISNSLREFNQNASAQERETAINYLISFVEIMLAHSVNDSLAREQESVILTLRSLRDSLLITREIQFDAGKLREKDNLNNDEVDRVKLARDSIQEIYSTITPISMPSLPS